MAVLYSKEEIQTILRELRIKPVRGLINTKEAADMLTWRAEHEYHIKHKYPDAAVRRHVEKGKLAAEKRGGANFFKVEDVFDVPLAPRRGLSRQKTQNAETHVSEKGQHNEH